MKFVSFEIIEKASEELNNLSEHEATTLIEKFSTEQPYVMTYLMAVYHDDLKEDERELLFFFGVKLWFAMLKVEEKIEMISEEEMDAADMDSEEMLKYLSEESEEGFAEFAENLLNEYPQGDLLQFALLAIMEEEEEEEEIIQEENKAVFFMVLKTVIDCFERK